jgi:hypothetical protein
VKDFIAPQPLDFNKCGRIDVVKQDDDSPASALQGAVFTLYNDSAPIGSALGAEDTATALTCTTGADGKCSFIGGAAYDDTSYGNHPADVNIPQ